MTLRAQDRIFPKLLDDSGLERSLKIGAAVDPSDRRTPDVSGSFRRPCPWAPLSAGCVILRATKRFQRLNLLFLQLESKLPHGGSELNLVS
jgi:hypothetical protein